MVQKDKDSEKKEEEKLLKLFLKQEKNFFSGLNIFFNGKTLLGKKENLMGTIIKLSENSYDKNKKIKKYQKKILKKTKEVIEIIVKQLSYIKKFTISDKKIETLDENLKYVLGYLIVKENQELITEKNILSKLQEKLDKVDVSHLAINKKILEKLKELIKNVGEEREIIKEEKEEENRLLEEEKIIKDNIKGLDNILERQLNIIKDYHGKIAEIIKKDSYDLIRFNNEEFNQLIKEEITKTTYIMNYENIAKEIIKDINGKNVKIRNYMLGRINFTKLLKWAWKRKSVIAIAVIAVLIQIKVINIPYTHRLKEDVKTVQNKKVENNVQNKDSFWDVLWDFTKMGGKNKSAKEMDQKIGKEASKSAVKGIDIIIRELEKIDQEYGLKLSLVIKFLKAMKFLFNNYKFVIILGFLIILNILPRIGWLVRKFEKDFFKGLIYILKDDIHGATKYFIRLVKKTKLRRMTKLSNDEINKLSVEDIVNKYQKYLNNPRVIKEIERKSGVII